MSDPRIAIIGFGFSGLMVTANLMRAPITPGTTLYLIAPQLDGLGLAYSTHQPAHLLNVPAGRMSAFEEEPDHLLLWLQSPAAAAAKQRLGLTQQFAAADFIPRALYGAYLSSIWHQAQQQAAGLQVTLKLVETTATCIRTAGGLAVLTARGDAIAADKIVLATGNEIKPLQVAEARAGQVIQNPWASNALDAAATWPEPVVLVGAGLTAVDMVLSLRANGYNGQITVISRGGRWPQPHQPASAGCVLDAAELSRCKNASSLMHYLREQTARLGEWRPVIDALRPHTQKLWKAWPLAVQQRFIRRLMGLWNIHRHRMAPQIAAQIAAQTQAGTLSLTSCRRMEIRAGEEGLELRLHHPQGEQTLRPSRIMNCTGGEMQLARSANPLLRQALADRVIEAHANGLGLAADQHYRAWGEAYPNLYAIGTMMTGEWLETTAVPELRAQARSIAQSLTND